MRTETEIVEKFEQLNTLAQNMKEKHAYVDITTFACYTHMMTTFLWVMGESKDIPLETIMENELATVNQKEIKENKTNE
jgi:hypothetical protein